MTPPALLKALALASVSAGGVSGFATTSCFANRKCTSGSGDQALLVSISSVDYGTIDIAEDARRNMFGLERWANEYGIQKSDGFKLVEEDQSGKEVYAATTTYVPSGSPVLFVPEALILSSNKAIAELRGPGMAEAEARITADGLESELRRYYLMLKILLEVENGRESPWYSWLDSLPRYYTNAATMTDFCMLCLPPLMAKLASRERSNMQRLCSKETIKTVPFLSDDIKFHPRNLVKWAYQIVYTRAVETEDGDLRIVPYGDYFNHGSDFTEVEPSYDADGNYYAYASYDVPTGSPLRISYADPRNPSHLLARYGFLDENCPATYCKLLPPTVNQDMLDLGYSHDRMLFYSSGEVADEVWDIFLYQILSETGYGEQQALMRAHRAEDYDAKLALHNKYYPQTSAALLQHIDGFIEDIDKLIKKAQTVGVDNPDSPYIRYEHPRLPLIHRHNLFVREAFKAVRDRYSENPEVDWREATRVTVQECDETECAIAECVQTYDGEWECEGGLGDRPKTQTVIAAL